MDPILVSAASGMRARMESLEMLANNLSNASTGGYKSDREFYTIYSSLEATSPVEQGISPDADANPLIEKPWTDYSQGVLKQTGNALDIALDGPGFLTANGPSGVVYTRNGSLKTNASGVLTTADGYPLATTKGTTIQLTSNNPVVIDRDGTVSQDGQSLGQLAVADLDRDAIQKRGLNYYFAVDPRLRPGASTAVVRQGTVEESNVGTAEVAVRLVSVMRQFESLQKAMTIASDMNKSAVEEVAKIGN